MQGITLFVQGKDNELVRLIHRIKDKKAGRLARAAVHAAVSISAKRPADTGRLK